MGKPLSAFCVIFLVATQECDLPAGFAVRSSRCFFAIICVALFFIFFSGGFRLQSHVARAVFGLRATGLYFRPLRYRKPSKLASLLKPFDFGPIWLDFFSLFS